ncbi:MAG TPA: OmpA family protein [Candidatus Methylomirabilis sp.]|nr:OmpA family protein [Candidatus Methylomirabilis sp.]
MKLITRTAVLLPAVLILVSACATKGWVRQTLDKRDAEMGQRVETVDQQVAGLNQQVNTVGQRVDTVEGRVTQDSQQISAVDSRVNTLNTSITETSEAARGAKEAAIAAMAKADGVDQRVTRIWTNRYNPKLVETVQVLFGFDKAVLDDKAQTSLTDLVKDLKSNENLTVELTGYTDMRGSREYNYQLSQRRVEAVRRFLIEHGVQMSRIQSASLGPVASSSGPDAEKRRVTANLMLAQD